MSLFKRSASKSPSPGSQGSNSSRKLQAEEEAQTRLEVYERHWQQILAIIQTTNAARTAQNIADDIEAVLHYFSQMMFLLIEEKEEDGCQGPILRFTLTENLLEVLFNWCNQSVEFRHKLKFEQLKMYEQLISQARQRLLVHKPIIRPLMKLLSSCSETKNIHIEQHEVLLLHQLCVCLSQDPQLLELFFSAHEVQGSAKFLVFSLLIPYVHREANLGQQARDALLLIMSLSAVNEEIGKHVAEHSDFCPVLATGLSGLYSSLPRKLEIPTSDWYQLTREDWLQIPDLGMFLNSLEFCNAVAQVAHPMVRDQLLSFIYNGFLVPVLGPALHQDISGLPMSILEKLFVNSMDEVIAATAYLDLFLRRITEPALMRTFLKFILTEHHDEINILESLITRISSNSKLCVVSLGLFKTLLDLNCEDVMYQLVFKYLVPCTHVMVSQRKAVGDVDLYSKAAEKFLALIPNVGGRTGSVNGPQGAAAAGTVTMVVTKDLPVSGSSGHPTPASPEGTAIGKSSLQSAEKFETCYQDYLDEARQQLHLCAEACHCWSSLYDSEDSSLENAGMLLTTPRKCASESVLYPTPTPTDYKNILSDFKLRTESAPNRLDPAMLGSTPLKGGDVQGSSGSLDSSPGTEGSNQKCQSSESRSNRVSSASDVDSALSSSASNVTVELNGGGSESDAALSDSFSSDDLESFLTYLKRVKSPIEICDNLEDSLHEIDDMIESLKNMTGRDVTVQKGKSETDLLIDNNKKRIESESQSTTQNNLLQKDGNSCTKGDLGTRSAVVTCDPKELLTTNHNTRPRSLTSSAPESKSSPNLSEGTVEEKLASDLSAMQALKSVQQVLSITEETRQDKVGGGEGAKKNRLSLGKSGIPTKYTPNQPTVGPFLNVLLTKLEGMIQNSFDVNLLLTGVITRLACYPQPLLRSYLLNHNLVFQPSVKSLVQVLHSVKTKVETYAKNDLRFSPMLVKCHQYMVTQEGAFLAEAEERRCTRTDSVITQKSSSIFYQQLPPHSLPTVHEGHQKEKKRGLADLFRRSGADKGKSKQPGKDSKLEITSGGARYINRKKEEKPEPEKKPVDPPETKNAAFCAIILEEFLKELAAISQEQAVLMEDEEYTTIVIR
ncbi:FTS and Hook-interacting protein isoform X2 [Lingula anatina]|uniref:FTS and Hook-interacting protein isoform X2 n=1 Tax=Lingula anatina TaxID=7574 RepID=A0A1S3HPP9_LINAN|nr:FTS and Hook-interacting protein isoform X2 [Lingula anatina]|eukprot:XP_013387521.1 FTS and Hook-interacting protein isoform X2 [Lingula anatina]